MAGLQSPGNHADLRSGLIPESADELAYLESSLTPERLKKVYEILNSRRLDIIPVMYSLFDTYNIAAIMRTAEAFGLQEAVIIEERNHNKHPKVVTKGCERWLTIRHFNTFAASAAELKQRGYQLVVADMDGIPLDKFVPAFPLALIVGAEHEGVPPEIRKTADAIISIPMRGFSQSMNVSVSMAIILSNLLNKAGFHNPGQLPPAKKEELRRQWLMKAVPYAEDILRRYRAEHGN